MFWAIELKKQITKWASGGSGFMERTNGQL